MLTNKTFKIYLCFTYIIFELFLGIIKCLFKFNVFYNDILKYQYDLVKK